MAHSVALLLGPGTAQTPLTASVLRVLAATGVDIDWRRVHLDGASSREDLIDGLREIGRALMPYIPVDRDAGAQPPIVALRRELGVYGNVRPLESLAGMPTRHTNVDLIVVRETTEDVYASLEHESIAGVYESFKVTTEAACERIARHAFELARQLGRKKVTIVHKANIMKMSDGLFLRTGRRVAEDYPDVMVEDCIVDALCMKLVLDASRFDVLVCANLFGDIVADLCAGLVGGAHNSPSINVADGVRVFTQGHGDPVGVASTERACPTSLMFSGVLMLRDLGEGAAADRMMAALRDTLAAGVKPLALGGECTATAFADAVVARM